MDIVGFNSVLGDLGRTQQPSLQSTHSPKAIQLEQSNLVELANPGTLLQLQSAYPYLSVQTAWGCLVTNARNVKVPGDQKEHPIDGR